MKTMKWNYDIGDRISSDNRDMVITDKKMTTNETVTKKYYKYKCLKCGFDCGEHYYNDELIKEFWIVESNLKHKQLGCACCRGTIVVPGINDIPTTAPWMIEYFQNGYNEAKKYTCKSNKKIFPKCPDCGKVKNKEINICNICKIHSIGCDCSDHKSYPNKFSYVFLEQLPVINVQHEYQPDWLKPYFYDNYFEYKNQAYVLEMDGRLGHGNFTFGTLKKDTERKRIDDYKDKIAKNHNIKVIRIDCIKSEFEYIKNNIISSELNDIFNLTNIDWEKCDEFALKNLIKEVCLFWEKSNHPRFDVIRDKFKIKSDYTISSYLEKGDRHGWCHFHKRMHLDKIKKKVAVYDIKEEYLDTFPSINELVNKSYKLFGVQFNHTSISKVCNKEQSKHKGYTFEWAD